MKKEIFQKRFPTAVYSGREKTFFVNAGDYNAACKFIMHRFAEFKVVKKDDQ